MSIDVTCPRCNHEFDLLHARDDDDWRELMELILALPPVTHRSLWVYLGLFRGKNKLRSSKMLRVVKQLAPMIKAAQVQRNGNDYSVPPAQFASAIEYLVDNPPASLVLPLKSNGYLLSILANRAEQILQAAEKKTEQKKAEKYRDYTNTPASKMREQSGSKEATKPFSKHLPDDLRQFAGLPERTDKSSSNDH